MKLQTPVTDEKCKVGISYNDKIMMLGSCFSDNIGRQLLDYGFDVCVNPFGTLYNPVSVLNSIERLAYEVHFQHHEASLSQHNDSELLLHQERELLQNHEAEIWFREKDCVQIGAGDERWCSFSHHTSFARQDKDEFLAHANAALKEAREFFSSCNKIIITLGTSWCFHHVESGRIVSNCLKHPASEFVRERLSASEITSALRRIAELCRTFDGTGCTCANNSCDNAVISAESIKPKQIILTVSPIRHFKDGAHGNQISKSALLLGLDDFLCGCPVDLSIDSHYTADYFPAYEIVMDELRDYRFYAEDMCHPSAQTVGYIRDRFLDWALPPSERQVLEENIRNFKRRNHVTIR